MALTLAVTLLGVVLEDADLLALAVLDDLALHRSALHHGSAEGGFVAVQDGQDLLFVNFPRWKLFSLSAARMKTRNGYGDFSARMTLWRILNRCLWSIINMLIISREDIHLRQMR